MRTAIVCLLLFAASLGASPVGSITGQVKDPSNALVPGAKLTLTNVSTNQKLETVTDANGAFRFLQLPPAEYSVVVQAAGFKEFKAASVLVQIDLITRLYIGMEIGGPTEVVDVPAVVPLLEPDRSTLVHVIDSQAISNMPLNTRQVLDLALLTPGAQPAAIGVQGGGFNAAGARSQSNVEMVDGVSAMLTTVNSPLTLPRIADAVQEFAVQTSVASAEFGRGSGGQVNIVTKSGGNQVHGSVFEYFRNSNLDAADFFTNKLGGTKNPLHRNQYGATLGGPVVRNKTFFFGSWEGFRQIAPTVSTTRVPTSTERASVTDPVSRALLAFWPAPNTLSPGSPINFIANVRATSFDNTGLIKIDRILGLNDRLSVRWIEYRGDTFTPGALPDISGGSTAALGHAGALTETHAFSAKLLNEWRIGFSRAQGTSAGQDQGFDASTIIPGAVQARQNPLDSGLPTIGTAGGYASLGSVPGFPNGFTANTYEVFDNMSLAAPFGAVRHSWRWGVHIRREQLLRAYVDIAGRGQFNFASFADFAAGRITTSTFLAGSTNSYWRRYPWDLYWQDSYRVKDNLTMNFGIRYEYPSAVSQTRNQATNFIPGVGPVLVGTSQVLAIDPSKKGPTSLSFTQASFTLSASGVDSDKNNFAPMIGFAYTPRFAHGLFGADDTVIRGGFRVGYDEIFFSIPGPMARNPPHGLTTSQVAGVTQPDKFPWALGFDQNVPFVSNFGRQGPGTPTSGVLGFTAIDPNFPSAYLYQYNLGIQRRIGKQFSLEVDYQGSTGHKLGIFVDQNQPIVIVRDPTKRGNQAPNEQIFPYPFFAKLTTSKEIGNSNYNGMVITSKYQPRKGVSVQAYYTLSKSLDYDSSFYGSSGERSGAADAAHLFLERGPSSFDIRHRAVLTYLIDLPIGPGHRLLGWNNGVNRQVAGGWHVSGITTLQSGMPFTVFNTALDFSGLNQFNDRPDVIGSGPLLQDNRNPDAAFNTRYFSATPPTGRAGTSGRNQYYGPGLANWDLAAAKDFPFGGERIRLQFRGDFFNLFNHTNFANPQNNQSSAAFGKITQTVGTAVATLFGTSAGPMGGARVVQLSLRLQF